MSNATALRTVLEHIAAHPGEWRQDEWTSCFAGQTLRVLAGAKTPDAPCGCCVDICGLAIDGRTLYGFNIGIQAAELLGLTPDQAQRLFAASNNLERLAALVEEFAQALDVELAA